MKRPLRTLGAFLLALSVLLAATAVPGSPAQDVDPVGEAEGIAVTTAAAIGLAVGAAGGAAGGYAISEVLSPNNDDLAGVDDSETKLRMINLASEKEADNELFTDSAQNQISGSKLPALADAKLAAVNAIQNDSTKLDAKIEGRQAARDYISAQQAQLVRSHTVAVEATLDLANTSDNEGLSYGPEIYGYNGGDKKRVPVTVTLANGTEMETAVIEGQRTSSARAVQSPWPDSAMNISADNDKEDIYLPSTTIDGTSYDRKVVIDTQAYNDAWTRWVDLENGVNNNVGVFVDKSYQEIKEGNVSDGELYDPYVQARNLSPEDDYQTWALSSLTSAGVVPPEGLDGMRNMTIVVNDNRTYNGILLSESEPSGGYEIGTTYRAGNFSGVVAVQTPEQTVQLRDSDNFMVRNVTAPNGTDLSPSSIRYPETNVSATNIDEYLNTSARLQASDARIQARQQNLRNGGLGFGFDFGGKGSLAAVLSLEALLFIGASARRNRD